MSINDLLLQLRHATDSIDFQEVIALINRDYAYTPTRFTNGTLKIQQAVMRAPVRSFILQN